MCKVVRLLRIFSADGAPPQRCQRPSTKGQGRPAADIAGYSSVAARTLTGELRIHLAQHAVCVGVASAVSVGTQTAKRRRCRTHRGERSPESSAREKRQAVAREQPIGPPPSRQSPGRRSSARRLLQKMVQHKPSYEAISLAAPSEFDLRCEERLVQFMAEAVPTFSEEEQHQRMHILSTITNIF